MDGACSTYGGGKEVYIRFSWGHLIEIFHLEDLVIDGTIILKWILKSEIGRHERGRDRWQELVNAVMNLRFP